MVCENPHMPKLVGYDGTHIVLIERVEKGFFKRHLKDSSAFEGLNRNDQCIIRNNIGKDFALEFRAAFSTRR